MRYFHLILAENRQTLTLAVPIIAGQLGQMLMGWADTIMIGRVGVTPLAACALANTVLAVFLVFGFGILSSIAIRASQGFGAGNAGAVGRALSGGVVLAALLGVIAGSLIHAGVPVLRFLGQPDEVVAESRSYLILIGWSLLPIWVAVAGKSFSESLSRPWLPFWFMLGGVFLNIFLNWLWIYGNWGFPRLELEGAGYATLVSRCVTLIALFVPLIALRSYAPYRAWFTTGRALFEEVGKLFRLGLPSGGQLLAEVGCFAFASLMMGWIGVVALASHQIALTCASTTFMFPLGLAIAATVRVGQVVGAGESHRIRPIAFGSLGMAAVLMSVFAVCFILGAPYIATWFVADPEVIALTATLLVIAGFFQIFDGVHVVSMGALRGMADVRIPFLLALICYWVVTIPVAATFAFGLNQGASGIWRGLAVGLAVAAVMLLVRLIQRTGPRRQFQVQT